MQKSVNLRPQITREYVASQEKGKPDFSLLSKHYEQGHKLYEPQYSVVANRRLFHESEESYARGSGLKQADEQLEKADVQFRETPSQDNHHAAVLGRLAEEEQAQLYDSFM